jgi:hypothetical protein
MRQIKESDVKAMLSAMSDNLPDIDRNVLKDLLRGLVKRITSNSQTLAYCIYYKFKLNLGELVASPGGLGQIPTISKRVKFQIRKTMRVAQAAITPV